MNPATLQPDEVGAITILMDAKVLKRKGRVSTLLPIMIQSAGKKENGHSFIASQVSVSDAGALRTFADNWKQKDYSDVLVLVAAIGDKVNVLVASKTKDVHAGNVIKELAPIVDGRGGGKPDMAMAGGSNQAKIQELLDAVAAKL